MIAWQTTDFDTEPYDIASTQVETFTYALPTASTDTLASASVRMLRLDTFEAMPELVTLVGVAGKIATVLVDATEGMVRGIAYELLVTLVVSPNDTEPMRTVFPCRA